ncbi:glycosyl hydrolase family 61-domain-containing protein [Crucibulum laeve]|uniref:lytic cellulose monooxygenase (C4-dehydrogenating) n=1 Tax=Crucibulum laeve TaxID=68775 RepID=A0A5C3M2Q0_9AGAR|nr:glycosyl hydrolase family 61-domain-containing protein [Crucibulum laeve]
MMKGFLTTLLLVVARLASAHYTFPSFIVNGTVSSDWQYVRTTANHWTTGPVTDINSDAMHCYELDSTSASQAGIAIVAAGSTVGFKASNIMGHQGYFAAYESCKPSCQFKQCWFKIWEWAPTFTPGVGLHFDSEGIQQFTFTIPKNTPNGQYLLRGEQIALHVAYDVGGARFYIGCAQINVVGGGNGIPSPTVSFPGAYSATDPGILFSEYLVGYSFEMGLLDLHSFEDIYPPMSPDFPGYKAPGPAIWSG